MTVYTYQVKVQSVSGSNKFFIDGYQQPALAFGHDITYRFDVSDSSNSGHVVNFSTTSDGTHGGGSALGTSDGYTTSGTAGSSGAYVQIAVTSSTASTLYYYCGTSGHTAMGGTAVSTSAEYVDTTGVALRKPILGNSDSWGQYINENLDTISGKLPQSFTFPTGTGSNNQAITSDGSGGSAWQDIALTPVITGLTWYSDSGYSSTLSASEAINIDDATYLKVSGTNLGSSGVFGTSAYVQIINTTQSNAVVGNNQSGLTGCVTSSAHQSETEWKFTINPTGVGSISAGDTLKVKAYTNGGDSLFATGYVISADPTLVTTVNSATISNTASVGTFGGQVTGGGQDINTKLLLNFDRAGGTDIEDSSNTGGDGHKITASGNTVIKSSPFGDGKSAMYFDGNDDYISVPASADWDFSGTDVTFEFWMNLSDVTNVNVLVSLYTDSNNNIAVYTTASKIVFEDKRSSSYSGRGYTSGADLKINTWQHVAIVYDTSATTMAIYIDGKYSYTSGSSFSSLIDASSRALQFGGQNDGGAYQVSGYIDEIRITHTAVYTGDFDVPTSRLSATQSSGTNISAITGTATKLLIHSNQSSNGSITTTANANGVHPALTVTGSTHSTGHGGIAPSMTWPASLKKTGSSGVYFDGDNDWIEIPEDVHDLTSTGTFTVELWAYPIENGQTYHCIFDTRYDGSAGADGLFVNIGNGSASSGVAQINANQNNVHITSNTSGVHMSYDAWNHLVICRDSAGKGHIYCNGKYAGTNAGSETWAYDSGDADTIFMRSAYKMRIGAYGEGSADYKGYIDNIRISNLDLTRTSTDVLYTGSSRGTSTSAINFTSGSLPTTVYGSFKSNTIDTVNLTGTAGTGGGYATFNNATLSGQTETTSALPAGLTLNEAESTDNVATITGDLTALSGSHAINLVARATSDGTNANIDPNRKTAYSHTITKGSGTAPVLFNARRYVGNDTVRDLNGFGFQPDLCWFKERGTTNSHQLMDSVRGGGEIIYSDNTNSKNDRSGNNGFVKSFFSDGITLSSDTDNHGINQTGEPTICWAWKAGGQPSGTLAGSGATATLSGGIGAGTIANDATGVTRATNITQSVNQNSGFSITKFTGHNDGVVIPHNLDGEPAFILIKNLTDANGWMAWHKNLTATSSYSIRFDSNVAESNDSQFYSTAPSPTLITGGDGAGSGGTSAKDYVCYAWKAVAGVSAFGIHSGQISSVSGTTVGVNGYCGFKPRFVMIKTISATHTGGWNIWDSFRDPDTDDFLVADTSAIENTSNPTGLDVQMLANGFTTGTGDGVGGSGRTYISIAFA